MKDTGMSVKSYHFGPVVTPVLGQNAASARLHRDSASATEAGSTHTGMWVKSNQFCPVVTPAFSREIRPPAGTRGMTFEKCHGWTNEKNAGMSRANWEIERH